VCSYLGKEELSAWVLDWLQTVENQSGVAPLIYTNYNYVSYFLMDPVADYDLWIAYWNCDPTPTYDIPPTGMWSDWGFWQYCVKSAGFVPGIHTPIDVNIFNGVEEGLSEFDAASPLWVSLTNYITAAPSPHYADITADVNGDAVGTINYAFWWDCTSLEVDITAASVSCGALPTPVEGECLENEYGVRCSAIAEEVKMVEHTYHEVGDYTAKVIVERGTAPPAEDRYHITVYNPILSITPDPISPGESILNQLFQMSVEVKIDTSLSGALQVELFENGQEVAIDQGCQIVDRDVRTTKTYDFSFSEAEFGLKNYTIWARYQPGQECPILNPSGDDRSEPYVVNWGLPEIDIQGNGFSILDGSTTPLLSNGTNFGAARWSNGTVTQEFSIVNTGDISLKLLGNPYVIIGGVNSDDFSVNLQPIPPVPAEGTATFEITFDPRAPGVRSAVISILNNDTDEDPYDFVIQGVGTVSSATNTADFDGDGDIDISVYKPEIWGGTWYIKDQGLVSWGNAQSIPVPSDYDGDGVTDIAVYNEGTWYIKDQLIDTWGDANSIPVQGDYDGDGVTDLAVFKIEPWGGTWYIKDQATITWGNSESIPVPNDYDGDGDTDYAVYNDGTWYVRDQFEEIWGDAFSIPISGDYNGDGSAELAFFKNEPWGGTWYIKDNPLISWGNNDSIPVPGDYDGDGTLDIAVYNYGIWYIKDQFVDYWGDEVSYPLPAPDTNGDGDPYQ
jgi:hypothetical protein